jgi:hypothetical protein
MKAIYYNTECGPFTMYVLDVPDAEHDSFLEAVDASDYPMPTADVIIMDGETIVDQWNPLAGAQNDAIFTGIPRGLDVIAASMRKPLGDNVIRMPLREVEIVSWDEEIVANDTKPICTGCDGSGWQTEDNEGFICDVCDRACCCATNRAECCVHQEWKDGL